MVLMSSFRMPLKDVLLLRKAAAREGMSQSQFLRHAIKEEAARALYQSGDF